MPRKETTEPEFLELEIPKRRVRLSAATRSLVEMDVDKKAAAFFAKPEGETFSAFSARVGSWISAARKHAPGHSYVKRMMTFDEGDGVAVWRVK